MSACASPSQPSPHIPEPYFLLPPMCPIRTHHVLSWIRKAVCLKFLTSYVSLETFRKIFLKVWGKLMNGKKIGILGSKTGKNVKEREKKSCCYIAGETKVGFFSLWKFPKVLKSSAWVKLVCPGPEQDAGLAGFILEAERALLPGCGSRLKKPQRHWPTGHTFKIMFAEKKNRKKE